MNSNIFRREPCRMFTLSVTSKHITEECPALEEGILLGYSTQYSSFKGIWKQAGFPKNSV
jgi:hypothetical protein